MPTRARPVKSSPLLPRSTDVVIIGGGIVGVSTALFLLKKGVSVTLCEKGEIAGEQSSRNWGWCRTQSRDPRELPLAMESLRLWGRMNELIDAETGFRRCGILSLSETDEQLEKARALLEHAKLYQTDSRIVSLEAIRELVPGSPRNWAGGVYSPSDGRAEPEIAAPAMAEGVQKLGGVVLTNCAVRGVETSGGTVSGVVTEKGRIICQAVVLAGGAWSSLMCDSLGLRLPQLKVLGNVMRTAPIQGGPEISTSGPGFGLRKRLDGGYNIAFGQSNEAQIVPDSFKYFFEFLPRFLAERDAIRLRLGHRFITEWKQSRRRGMDEVSPFEQVRILDPKPLKRDLDAAQRNLTAAFPVFENMQVLERWAGLIDATPDAVPVISAVTEKPGFFISTGFSGHGFGIGPGAGKLMADLVTGDTPIVDPNPFDFSRLRKGNRAILREDILAGIGIGPSKTEDVTANR